MRAKSTKVATRKTNFNVKTPCTLARCKIKASPNERLQYRKKIETCVNPSPAIRVYMRSCAYDSTKTTPSERPRKAGGEGRRRSRKEQSTPAPAAQSIMQRVTHATLLHCEPCYASARQVSRGIYGRILTAIGRHGAGWCLRSRERERRERGKGPTVKPI